MFSCGEELTQYDVSVKTPVIESYLETGGSELTVKVYSMESFNEEDDQLSKAIKGLNLYINDILMTEKSAGTYSISSAPELLLNGNKCSLRFDYNGKTITADANLPSKPVGLSISQSEIERSSSWSFMDSIPEVKISWENPDNSYYQVYIQSLSQTSGSTQAPPFMGGGFGKMMMQPIQGNSYTLKIQDVSFGGYYRCILYKISKDYAELYEQISSTDLSNSISFINNGLGIFTAYSSDTLQYKVVYTD